MSARKSLLVDAAMIAALVIVGVAGYHFSPALLPVADMTAEAEAGCDLQRDACSAVLPNGGRLRFALTPRPIAAVDPMQMSVEIEGAEADRVLVDFAGASMNMGSIRQPLQRTAPGRFSGESALPVCVTGRMTWVATVLIEAGRTRTAVSFRFEAGRQASANLRESGNVTFSNKSIWSSA